MYADQISKSSGEPSFCARVQQGLAQATFEQKRQLVELLLDRVVVTNEEVEIRYVIPTSPRSETIPFYQLRTDYCRTLPPHVRTRVSASGSAGGCRKRAHDHRDLSQPL